MRKLIRTACSIKEADRICKLAKSLPGVMSANKYRVSTNYHCMIYGDISDEVYQKIMGRHRNLAETGIKQ